MPTNIDPNCTACNGKGYIYVNNIEAESCGCVHRGDFTSRMSESGVPKKLFSLSLEDWNVRQDANGDDISGAASETKTRIFETLQSVSDDQDFPFKLFNVEGNGHSQVCFVGERLSGKSLCLAILCQSAVRNGALVRYYDWYDIASVVQRFDDKAGLERIKAGFFKADMVVIDDIDPSSDINSLAYNQIKRLLNHRENQDMLTVWSCRPHPATFKNPVCEQLWQSSYKVVLP